MILNKIFTFKNIMFVLCVGIAIISTFFSCEVRAVTQNLINLNYEVSSSSSVLDELIEHFNVDNKNASNKNFDTMKTEWSNATRKSFEFSYTNYGNQYNKIFWYGSGNGPATPNNVNLNFRPSNYFKLNSWRGGAYTASYQYDSSFSPPQPDSLYYCCYIDENNNLWEYSSDNYSVVSGLTPPFVYTPVTSLISGDYIYTRFTYVGNVYVGTLGDNDYYQLDIYLIDSNGYKVGTFSDVPGVGSISDNVISVNSSLVDLNSIYLNYYTDYILRFRVYSNLYDYIDYDYNYIFIPQNAIVSDNAIVSSGDVEFNNQFIAQYIDDIYNNEDNLNSYLSWYFPDDFFVPSGDYSYGGVYDFHLPSGELWNVLNYDTYDNDYQDFIYGSVYVYLNETLLSSGDVIFNFNYMGNDITLSSNQFITPDGLLKSFVSSFLVFATFYYFYKTIIHGYHLMQEGNAYGAINTWAIDDESLLM